MDLFPEARKLSNKEIKLMFLLMGNKLIQSKASMNLKKAKATST